eukprot:gene30619-52793_t
MSQNQFDKKSQAWSALFSEPMSDLVKRYTSSVFFDKRLWQADITGSLAHADMLAARGIIAAEDHAAIQKGMAQIWGEIESGAFEWKLDLEDVHLNIEARLTQLVGDAGKRLFSVHCRDDHRDPHSWEGVHRVREGAIAEKVAHGRAADEHQGVGLLPLGPPGLQPSQGVGRGGFTNVDQRQGMG